MTVSILTTVIFCPGMPHNAGVSTGHSSVVTVMLRGEPDARGFVIDFGEAKQLVKETLATLRPQGDCPTCHACWDHRMPRTPHHCL